jgi:hypothetical protein
MRMWTSFAHDLDPNGHGGESIHEDLYFYHIKEFSANTNIGIQFPILLNGPNMAKSRRTLYFEKIKVTWKQTLIVKKGLHI